MLVAVIRLSSYLVPSMEEHAQSTSYPAPSGSGTGSWSSLPLFQQDIPPRTFYHKQRLWHSLPNGLKTKRCMKMFSTAALAIFLFNLWNLPMLPPLYKSYKLQEALLPQNLDTLTDLQSTKYFFPANHIRGLGWGNALQELFLNAHLAYSSGRSFVWDDYTWNRDGLQYSLYNWKLIPSRVPLSALVRGPINGGVFPPGENAPLSISKERFSQLCPNRTIFTSEEVAAELGYTEQNPPVGAIFDHWVERLKGTEDPCVEMDINSFQIFDYHQFSSDKILEVWPSLSQSPMITAFDWSPLIYNAFERNHRLFHPSLSFSISDPSFQTIPGLLALHLRRGDFEAHCQFLMNNAILYNGFNRFPELPDRFEDIPPEDDFTSRAAVYASHCYPTIQQIVDKVRIVRFENPELRNIFLMTNGKTEWIAELTRALNNDLDWDSVHNSRELELTHEEEYIKQAVDMLIAQKADVFVGNGFSSLTSNVVMLRASKKLRMSSMRFW